MRFEKLKRSKIELIIYLLIWILVFSLPYFVEKNLEVIHWNKLYFEWLINFLRLILFFVNVYILAPKYFFEKNYKSYFTYIGACVAGILLIISLVQPPMRNHRPPQDSTYNIEMRPAPVPPKPLWLALLENVIVCALIIGTGTGSKLLTKWLTEEKLRKEIEQEQLKTNLALLRHQVSPHFFMNTLNNIHALIDINTDDAKDAIVRLSTMMRYLLYDSAKGNVSLKKEIEFLNSYISLMRMRFPEKVKIDIVIPEVLPDLTIPPMLFISFLENAFKHGVSYNSPSYIYFELKISENEIVNIVRNSAHKTFEIFPDEYSGIGLDNIKKSLKLLFDENYNLTILNNENEFEINLTIKL